ncbi:hypothetical protein ACF068_28760 [Streptomyces sp. NPDC016309]|uniref:hypothetical protein n=1 Tax=Streptomyces sp. NPDC016309 TaxID=3364965 RepID=UPI0037034C27
MSDEYGFRSPSPADRCAVRTVVPVSERPLTDEDLLARYPALREVAERWAAQERPPGRAGTRSPDSAWH